MLNNLNDYELIYLYRENSERAEKLLFEKYAILITKILAEKKVRYDYEDIYEECLIILHNCIKRYNMDSSCSFFNYFLVCMKRHIVRAKMQNKEYNEYLPFNDDIYIKEHFFCENSVIYDFKNLKNDFENMIYKEIFEENMSPRLFAKNHNVDIKKVYNTIYNLRKKLKKVIK